MSEIEPSVVGVTKLLFEIEVDSASPVSLRVKPDRRQQAMTFPEAIERRLTIQAAHLSEVAVVRAGRQISD